MHKTNYTTKGDSTLIIIKLDEDGTGKNYDDAVAMKEIPKLGTTIFVSKSNATQSGRPIVALIIPVEMPDGTVGAFSAHYTAREFVMMAAALEACHPGCGDRDTELLHAGKMPQPIHDHHRGVGYSCIAVEKVYLITCEAAEGQVSIGGSEQEARMIAKTMIDRVLGPENR